MTYTATYSPEDNKLRLYTTGRLDAATYERVKAAGFRWAPAQELWVAPAWSPERADLLSDLAGEIGDEDTSLVDRAEARADRFEEYSEHRAADSEATRKAVAQIADMIPFGQPILVGHHSEKRARRDHERIASGMSRAVEMWETSQYWTARAASAVRAAKYKERPDVRARRIKKLEAELRGQEREQEQATHRRKLWATLHEPDALPRKDGQPWSFAERATYVASFHGLGLWSDLKDGKIAPEEAQARCLAGFDATLARTGRWVAHLSNRLAYERAMLGESGGTVADRTRPEKGGAVRCWVNRGAWCYVVKVNKVSVTVLDNWGNGGENFTRTVPFDKLAGVMSAAAVQAAREAGWLRELDNKTGFRLVEGEAPCSQP
jgi:Domain of unknown function (DUF3560)